MTYEKADHLEKEQIDDQGAVYTPKEIALKMAKMLKLTKRELVIDPCCGKGNLFVALLETYSFLKNEDLYGVDIDPEAIKFCKNKFPDGNFQVGDILKDPFESKAFWDKPIYTLWKDYIKTKEYKKYSEEYPDKIPKEKPINQKIDFSSNFGKL